MHYIGTEKSFLKSLKWFENDLLEAGFICGNIFSDILCFKKHEQGYRDITV